MDACSLGFGDADGFAPNGCECIVSGSGIDICDGIDQDCNGLVDDAPLAVVADDEANCGACGVVCPPGPTNLYAKCSVGQCTFAACPAGLSDADGDPTNACEYACTPAIDFTEVCNELDDDCDGVTDESYDVLSDPQNCGECGVDCTAGAKVESAFCDLGLCVITECELGSSDANGDHEDRCEHSTEEWWVDPFAPSGGDGSPDAPFQKIVHAFEVVSAGDVVRLLPGPHFAPQDSPLTADGVAVVGAGQGVEVSQFSIIAGVLHAFWVKASGTLFQGFTIKSAGRGIRFEGTASDPIAGATVRDVHITNSISTTTLGSAGGIQVDHGSAIVLEDLTIEGVTSAAGASGQVADQGKIGNGYNSYGIFLGNVSGCEIRGSSIDGVTGGKGSSVSNCFGGCYKGALGGRGGSSIGIYMKTTTGCVVTDTSITDIPGGPGGNTSHGCAGQGGHGYGVYMSHTTNGNRFEGVDISGVGHGGPGTGGYPNGGNGTSMGVYVSIDSRSNHFEGSSFEAEPLIYVHGVEGLVLDDLALIQNARPSNLGKVVILDSKEVTLSNSTIAGYLGGQGGPAYGGVSGGKGWQARGVYLIGCEDCVLSGNHVFTIEGGRGGTHWVGVASGPGAEGWGIHLEDSPGALLADNHVELIQGGLAGTGGSINNAGGAYGIDVMTSPGTTVVGGRLSQISSPGTGSGSIAAGTVVGLRLVDSTGLGVSHLRIQDISGLQSVKYPPNNAPVPSRVACIQLDDTPLAELEHITCHDVSGHVLTNAPLEDHQSFGVFMTGSQIVPATLRSSVFSDVIGRCFEGLASATPRLHVEHSVAAACGALLQSGTKLTSVAEVEDALFVDAESGDLHLQATSPAIDAGDPAADYCLEPAPNGCRVNAGAFGGTDETAAKEGAEHCPCE